METPPQHLPQTSGVYFFIGARREVLYIGKATNLRDRVRSYFTSDIEEKRSPLIARMVQEAKRVETVTTDSVLEAVLLEANLIRTHTPRYNTVAKDDKSYNHLIITKEDVPRVLVVRGKDLSGWDESLIAYHFGPFPDATLFREALRIIQKIFSFYDNVRIDSTSKVSRGRIAFNKQIGIYPQHDDPKAYARTIRHIALLFSGKKQNILRELERDMRSFAKAQKFEEAAQVKRQIDALTHIQDVSLLRRSLREHRDARGVRIEAYDIAHLQGKAQVGVMTVLESGEPARHEYRTFTIKTVQGANDTAALREVLTRRLAHTEWDYPALIVLDGGAQQMRVAEEVLRDAGVLIPFVAVTKDEHHRPKRIVGPRSVITQHNDAILLANAEAHRFSITKHRNVLRRPLQGKITRRA